MNSTLKMRLLGTARDQDTICALATARGLGAISVVRVSGPRAEPIVRQIASFLPVNLESHRVYYGVLRNAASEPIDEVLISYFQPGRSFTGEAVFEISCHGSEAVVEEILRQLVAAGARPADRGEFTYRAFMQGRIDLVQAESILSLIESRSVRASRLALRQLQGELSKCVRKVLDDVTWVLANLEANIDFAAEDIVVASDAEIHMRLSSALKATDALLASYRPGRVIREGLSVALTGRPNAGKSSLFNSLVGSSRAIVTSVPGTTRDLVSDELMLDGIRVQLFDTAGLRFSSDEVETIGVRLGLQKIFEADFVLYVLDAEAGLSEEDHSFFEQIPWERTLLILNKVDLVPTPEAPPGVPDGLGFLAVSASTSRGLDELKDWLRGKLREEVGEDSPYVSHARHFHGLGRVRDGLGSARSLVSQAASPDLVALELQDSIRALHEILGLEYDDQVMDRVFSEFCIGK